MAMMENPVEREKRIVATAMSFSDRNEEELIAQLFEESENKRKAKEEAVETVLIDATFRHKPRPGAKWDVPISETIYYFDPSLSYELTGYRPITMDSGLDFDVSEFTKAKESYYKNGVYTEFPKGSKFYRDFWDTEYDRCDNGMTVGKYRLTGDHYFFLNYYRMQVIKEGTKAGGGRDYDFPGFFAPQYEFFHYVEMAEKLHKDVCILKGRGVGLSEIVASLGVRPYTTKKNYNVLLAAVDEAKLSKTRRKLWYQLDWLNMNTQGGFRHIRQKVNNMDVKRASKINKDGDEYGWMSQIETIVADRGGKIRGDRLDRIIFEEAGSWKDVAKEWIQANALVELGGYHFGTRIALGTGGDDMALGGLSNLFNTPEAYNILPFKNVDTDDGKPALTAYFIPSHKFSLMDEYIDDRGVTNHIEFKKHYEAQRAKLSDRDYLTECAEHCFTPREALSKHSDNVFDASILAERIIQLKQLGGSVKPTQMQLLWDKTAGEDKVIARESSQSHLWIVEPPMTDDSGNVFSGLYVAGIDAIDMGRNDSATDFDVSDFCILIKKRAFGMDPPKYVAMYKYRPNDIRQAYDITIKLLT